MSSGMRAESAAATTTMSGPESGSRLVDRGAARGEVLAEEALVELSDLIEVISIDGMCGVY